MNDYLTAAQYEYALKTGDWDSGKVLVYGHALNDNQQTVFEWLKEEHFDSSIKSVLRNMYFYVNMAAISDLESVEIQDMVNAYENLSQVEFAQVIEVFSKWSQELE